MPRLTSLHAPLNAVKASLLFRPCSCAIHCKVHPKEWQPAMLPCCRRARRLWSDSGGWELMRPRTLMLQ